MSQGLQALWQYTKEIIAWATATIPAQLAVLIAIVGCLMVIWLASQERR